MKQDQAHSKITLLFIKDWDGFQAAMREVMRPAGRRQNGAGREGQ